MVTADMLPLAGQSYWLSLTDQKSFQEDLGHKHIKHAGITDWNSEFNLHVDLLWLHEHSYLRDAQAANYSYFMCNCPTWMYNCSNYVKKLDIWLPVHFFPNFSQDKVASCYVLLERKKKQALQWSVINVYSSYSKYSTLRCLCSFAKYLCHYVL